MTGFSYFIWGGEGGIILRIKSLGLQSDFILYHFSIQHEHYACSGVQIFNFVQQFNRRTAVELCSFASLLQNPCYASAPFRV